MTRPDTVTAKVTDITKELVRMAAREREASISAWTARAVRRQALLELSRNDPRLEPKQLLEPEEGTKDGGSDGDEENTEEVVEEAEDERPATATM